MSSFYAGKLVRLRNSAGVPDGTSAQVVSRPRHPVLGELVRVTYWLDGTKSTVTLTPASIR